MKTTLFLVFFILQAVSAFSYEVHITKEDNINVRADSTILSESLGTLDKGESIEVLEEKYGWLKIRLPDDFPCYVHSDYIEQISANKGKITASTLNLRSSPSLGAYVIGDVGRNTIVKIVEKGKEWTRIGCYPYARGWVHHKFTKPIAKTDNFRHLVIKILSEMTVSDFDSKKKAHRKLIDLGKDIIPVVSSYLPAKDKDVNYSIIFVFTELGEKHPELIEYFFNQIDSAEAKLSGIYLDIIQNLIKPKSSRKKPYFYLSINGKLSETDIEKAKKYLKDIYKLNTT
ncbi:MAG: SH3 domain-containing protein [Candidatus Omnitrophica bacterium]|nr:SH3 domain-containing protein [Candidatus Omnitrophota bacterium]MBD3269874.1 SH3 domain-containing protein [Candidatus Omnitrophota bacterium]